MNEPPSLRALCVTLWGDRAEAATFIGLAHAGCRMTVFCMPDSPYAQPLEDAGLRVVRLVIRKRVDREAIARIREELATGDYDILHLMHNRAVSNGLIAVKGFDRVKVIAYRGIVGNVSMLNPISWFRYLSPRIDRVICVAEAVRQYFVANGTLPYEKIIAVGYGSMRPLASNATESGRAVNRRIDVIITPEVKQN